MHNNTQKTTKIPYPRINLEKAYNYLLKIRAAYPTTTSLTRSQIVQVLDLTPTSGTAHTALGALSHYGFAYKTGLQQDLHYHLTDLALKLVDSWCTSEWRSFAFKSVRTPETFNFLYSYHEDDALPRDIEDQLIKRYDEVTTKNVATIIKLYHASMAFIDRDLPAELSIDDASTQKQYTFSLHNGMTISAPEEVIIKALMKYYSEDRH